MSLLSELMTRGKKHYVVMFQYTVVGTYLYLQFTHTLTGTELFTRYVRFRITASFLIL